MVKILAIVPMRHDSQRVQGKNYRTFGDKPLYFYILQTLLNNSEIDSVIIDTDSKIIKEGVHNFLSDNGNYDNKIKILDRPVELTGHDISMNRIIESILVRIDHLLNKDDIILQTHVTNPFLSGQTITRAIETFKNNNNDSLVSVNSFQRRMWSNQGQAINHNPNELKQTQDLAELYEENSNLYLFNYSTFLSCNNRIGQTPYFFKMDRLESWDIDTEEDFMIAESMLKLFNFSQDESLEQKEFLEEQKEFLEEQQSSLKAQKESLEQKESFSTSFDESLYSLLHQELREDLEKYLSDNQTPYRILISAPYMMKDIDTFVRFYQSIGLTAIVADVEERLSENDLLKYTNQYDIVVCGDDAFTRKILTQSKIKAICKWGTGIDSIDQSCCQELGVKIYNTPDAFSIPVAHSIMSAILSFLRQTHTSTNLMRNSNVWTKIPGTTLEEVTVGVIGLGNVGRATCKYLNDFGANILGYDIRSVPEIAGVNKVSLNELLEKSDIVCTCCNLEESSYHIINKNTLKQMKKGSYFINMARGKLVNENDLIEALNSKHLLGVALDVFEVEPLPKNSPLRQMSNVLISSHNANSSQKYWNKVHINTIRNTLKAIGE